MKKAVLINIDFYDYNNDVIASLEKKGYEVMHFSYKPTVSSIQKFRFKFSKRYQRKLIKKTVDSICEKIANEQIDLFLFINPTTFYEEDVKRIFANQEKAKKILYLWDAVGTYPIVKTIFDLFDDIYSFDIVDCKTFGFKYRPTFASKELLELDLKSDEPEYDIFYVASYSKARYFDLLKMKQICDDNNLVFKHHLFIKNKLAYLFFKFRNPKLKKRYVSLTLLGNKEKAEILTKTRAIFDTPLATQTGLTMRVIEGMILNKKIISTNKHLVDFDFYNENDFLIFDNNFDISKLNTPCSYKIDKSYYSADSLAEELIR